MTAGECLATSFSPCVAGSIQRTNPDPVASALCRKKIAVRLAPGLCLRPQPVNCNANESI
jgi:hypothetical protein